MSKRTETPVRSQMIMELVLTGSAVDDCGHV